MKSKLTDTEIKKIIYKQQPKAKFEGIKLGVARYTFPILVNGQENTPDGRLFFECEIPVSDMGEAGFYPEMEAKYLIRWLKNKVISFETIKQ